MIKFSSILLCFFFALSLSGQEPIRYTMNNGLPSNNVYDIAQDSDGYMWFATNRGLVKFDGTEFKTFTMKDGLPNNDIWGLEADDQGRIWYISKSKFQGYILNEKVFKFATKDSIVLSPSIYYYDNNKMNYQSNTISPFSIYNYYVVEDSILKLNKSISYSRYKSDSSNTVFKNYKPERNFYLTADKRLIIFDDSISTLDLKNQKHTIIETDYKYKNQEIKRPINRNRVINNDHYVQITNNGIHIINLLENTYRFYYFKDLINKAEFEFYRMIKTTDGLQISVPGYLMEFNNNLDLLKSHKFPSDIKNHSSFKDTEGNIWLINISNGITLIPSIYNETKYYLKNKHVKEIEFIDNRLFLGVENDYFYELDYISEQFYPIKASLGNIYDIKKYRSNILFISYKNSWLSKNNSIYKFQYNPISKNTSNYDRFKGVESLDSCDYIIDSSNFNVYDRTKNKYIKSISKAGLVTIRKYKDTIYVGGSDGLHYYVNDTLSKIDVSQDIVHIPINIIKVHKELLYIGTDGRGVYTYDNKILKIIKSTESLSINNITFQDNYMWLATQKGVKQILIENNNLSNSKIINAYNITDGLLQNNINDIAIRDSILFCATDLGLSKTNINNIFFKSPPQLHFNHQKDTLSDNYSKDLQFNISFSSMKINPSKNINYAYKLSPSSNNWIPTKSKTINISNLSPNEYILEVKTTNHHQYSTVKKIHINIIPLWYQTTKAKLIGILFILTFMVSGILIILRYNKSNQYRLLLQQKKSTALELRALRSQMNPNFIQNSLDSISTLLHQKKIDHSEEYLIKFSKLVRHFFDYAKNQSITLAQEIKLIENYLQIEKIRFNELLEIDIFTDSNLDTENIVIPSMIMQPIIENSINKNISDPKIIKHVKLHFSQVNKNSIQIDFRFLILSKTKQSNNTIKSYREDRFIIHLKQKIKLINTIEIFKINYADKLIKDNHGYPGYQITITITILHH